MELKQMWCGDVKGIQAAYDTFQLHGIVNDVIGFRVPQVAKNILAN
jgi:hypothetical protein